MSPEKGTMEGKVVIITGGGTGLGKSMALNMAKEGANIVVAARRAGLIEETAQEICKLGTKSLAIPTDVTDSTQVNQMVARTMSEFGKIDVLINNAGIVRGEPPKDIWEITDKEWHHGIDVNLSGAFFCGRAVAKYFADRKSGKIINVASGEGFRGVRNHYMYCCAKGGILQLTRTMAISLAPYNIQVNCIVPGFVDTSMYQSQEYRQALAERTGSARRTLFIPVGHTGIPDDIGYLGLFLASDASDFITGGIYIADGGGMTGGTTTTGYGPNISLEEALA
jgi:NAD(P)-dependent dehydrogenase (short-subunit alcohol dehydrogenase family)